MIAYTVIKRSYFDYKIKFEIIVDKHAFFLYSLLQDSKQPNR